MPPTTSTSTAQDQFDMDAMTQPVAEVDAYLRDFLEGRPLPPSLREAAIYAVLGPGKRLRPILVVRCCEAVGGERANAMPPAAAIEMIHAFSLVHDDLPAMDDDDLRRGRPTLHKHTNEAMAILAGDLLNTMAFEVIANRCKSHELAGDLIAELAVATNDMIAGQVWDTLPDFAESVPPMERLETIHKHKTGALIRCACRMGALAGGADAARLDAVTRYAEAIGLMFQVVDDLLDVTQTTEQLGKAANKDADAGKLTYPGLIGIEASRDTVERLHRDAHAALEPLGEPARDLLDLCDYMAVRTK